MACMGKRVGGCNCSLVAYMQNFEMIRVRLPDKELENIVKIRKRIIMMVLTATMAGMARPS